MNTTKLNKMFTTSQAASKIGCSSRSVQRHAKTNSIGTVVCGYRHFSERDITRLRSVIRIDLGRFAKKSL